MAISRKECERKIETEPNLCNLSSTAAAAFAASSNMILSQASGEKTENTANGKEPKSPKEGLDLVMCMRLSQNIVMFIFQQSLTKSVM